MLWMLLKNNIDGLDTLINISRWIGLCLIIIRFILSNNYNILINLVEKNFYF